MEEQLNLAPFGYLVIDLTVYLGKSDSKLNGSEKEYSSFSLLLIDVDYFKRVNDTYGHPIGDVVLQELAKKLQVETTTQDLVARMGGESL